MSTQPTIDALTQQRDRETWLEHVLNLRTLALHRVITERDEARALNAHNADTKGTDR